MKKFISIVCILLLLIATSNLAVHIHFCGNKISSINFFGKGKSCGDSCNAKTALKEKSCCKNFETMITTSDAAASIFSFKTQYTAITLVPVIYTYTTEPCHKIDVLIGSIAGNAPPDISAQPYYIQYRSLII